MPRLAIPILTSALILTSSVAARAGGPAGAVLSQIKGEVTVLATAGAPSGQPARPLQLVAAGAALRLGPGAEAVVVCADDRALRLAGPTEWQAGPGACGAGRALAAGAYARLAPALGRVRQFEGSLLSEAPSRGDDGTGKVPVLVSPRSPQRRAVLVGDAAPPISWLEVKGALAYELALERGGGRQTARVEAVGADCRPDERGAPARVCSTAWPWPPLTAGQEVKLGVSAETADPDWRLREADPSTLRLADARVLREVEGRLAVLGGDDLPAATHELLRASAYADVELFNEAAAALAASLADRPQAGVAVRLADLYLGLGLLRPALNEYGQAERLLPPRVGDDETRAAVYFGLGRLYSRRDDSALAADHYQKAARLFRRLGWSAEADAAEAEAERAARGLS